MNSKYSIKNKVLSLLVSVIIPNYNHAPYLAKRIESILDQTYQEFEIIILDDFSTDESKTIIEQYRGHPKVASIIYNNENSGSPFLQWKKGMSVVKGDFVWIAESDDFSDKHFLQTAIDSFRTKECDIYWCNSYAFEKGEVKDFQYAVEVPFDYDKSALYESDYFLKKYLLRENIITNISAMVFKRSLLTDVEINVNFKLCGDWLLYIFILQQKITMYYDSQRLNYYRLHTGNTSTLTTAKRRFNEAKKIRKMLSKMLVQQEQREIALKGKYYDRGWYAMGIVREGRYAAGLYHAFMATVYILPDLSFMKGYLYWLLKKFR